MFGVDEEEVAASPDPWELRREAEEIAPRIDEIVERLEHPQRQFPIERAILVSLIVHILLAIAFTLAPPAHPAAEVALARREQAIPIKFFVPPRDFVEAPGRASAETRKGAPLSDKTRRAAGGDRTRPKSESPYVPPSPGMEGLAPGQRSREAASRAPAEPRKSTASRSAAAAPARGEDVAANSQRGFVVPRGGPSGADVPDLNSAIRQATGSPFAGEGGAPRSNPGGGFVDYGSISFDTQGFDWGDYAEEMLRKIKIHWYEQIPKLFEMGPDGELSIRFYIRADGTVEEERVLRTSGIPPYDHAAFMGISDSNPFRPLPKELHEDREGVTITFRYLHWREKEPAPQIR